MDMTNLPLRVGRRLLYLTLHVLLVWSNHAWVPPSLCCCTKSHIATNTSLTCINPLHMHTIILFYVPCCTHHIETLFRNRMFCSFLLNINTLLNFDIMHLPPVISYLCIQGTINISHAILYPLLHMYFIKIMSNKLGNLLAYVCSHCILLKHFSTLSNSKAKNITTLDLIIFYTKQAILSVTVSEFLFVHLHRRINMSYSIISEQHCKKSCYDCAVPYNY